MNYNLIAFDEKVQILMDPPLSPKLFAKITIHTWTQDTWPDGGVVTTTT